MLVEELDITIVDALCNFLTYLMRRTALDHVIAGPSVFSFGPRGRAYEEVVLELALEVILFNMVGKGSRDFSGRQ